MFPFCICLKLSICFILTIVEFIQCITGCAKFHKKSIGVAYVWYRELNIETNTKGKVFYPSNYSFCILPIRVVSMFPTLFMCKANTLFCGTLHILLNRNKMETRNVGWKIRQENTQTIREENWCEYRKVLDTLFRS